MTSLAGITVQDADGADVRLGALIARPTIIVVPRYYGCLPCRDYLQQVSDHLDEVEAAGAAALGISVGAAHQARWLMEEQGIRFPLLVDRERRFYDAIDLPQRWWCRSQPPRLDQLRAGARARQPPGQDRRPQSATRARRRRRAGAAPVDPPRARARRLSAARLGAGRGGTDLDLAARPGLTPASLASAARSLVAASPRPASSRPPPSSIVRAHRTSPVAQGGYPREAPPQTRV